MASVRAPGGGGGEDDALVEDSHPIAQRRQALALQTSIVPTLALAGTTLTPVMLGLVFATSPAAIPIALAPAVSVAVAVQMMVSPGSSVSAMV